MSKRFFVVTLSEKEFKGGEDLTLYYNKLELTKKEQLKFEKLLVSVENKDEDKETPRQYYSFNNLDSYKHSQRNLIEAGFERKFDDFFTGGFDLD